MQNYDVLPLQALLLEDKRPLDGYGTSGQPNGALIEWPFEAKNQLYYERPGMQLSETEKAEQVHVSLLPKHTSSLERLCKAMYSVTFLLAGSHRRLFRKHYIPQIFCMIYDKQQIRSNCSKKQLL